MDHQEPERSGTALGAVLRRQPFGPAPGRGAVPGFRPLSRSRSTPNVDNLGNETRPGASAAPSPNVDNLRSAETRQPEMMPRPAPNVDNLSDMSAIPAQRATSAGRQVPTRLATPASVRTPGPGGPDTDTHRRRREARKLALAKRTKAAGVDPGAGSAEGRSGATRSAATQKQYLDRGRMLLNKYRRLNGLGADMDSLHPVEFANWLISLQPMLAASTWRFYRQSAASVLLGLPHHETDAAMAMLDAVVGEETTPARAPGKTSKGIPRRTSALKEKRFPFEEFTRMRSFLRYFSRSELAPILSDWMLAGIATGLRPIEWKAAEIEVQHAPEYPNGRRAWLYVLNAKATNGRGNGVVRTLDLTNLSDEALASVERMADRGTQWLLDGKFDSIQSQVAQLIYTTSEKLFPKRPKSFSLYSLRHQFIANMKSISRLEEVSALVGHLVTNTAAESYGKRQSAWSPENISEVPSPIAEEVSTVRQRLRFFHERIRLHQEAGLLPAPDATDSGSTE